MSCLRARSLLTWRSCSALARHVLARCALTGLLVACYRPDYAGPYLCDPQRTQQDCPANWRCINRLCAPPGAQPSACAETGALLAMSRGGQVWSCPGPFPAGQLQTRCAPSPDVHVCGSLPHDESLLRLVDCDVVPGFYVSALPAALRDGTGLTCEPASGPPHALLGCGNATAAQFSATECSGLHHVLPCPAAAPWSCDPTAGLASASLTPSTDRSTGVLCCTQSMRLDPP